MPKCLINSVRDYKCGKYHGSFVYDPFVMTTRSGLSINTIPRGSSLANTRRLPSPPEQNKDVQPRKKETTTRRRSMNYMSFVTRFHISRRFPELDRNFRTSSKAFSDWKEELFRLEESRPTELNDSGSDSDCDDDICIGSVDDSPCTYSQSSDEFSNIDDDDRVPVTIKTEPIQSSPESEIDVVGNDSKPNLSENNYSKIKAEGPRNATNEVQTPTKYSVLECVSYVQANKLICTTIGPTIEFSLVNGYVRSATKETRGDMKGYSSSGTQKKIVTLTDASNLFFVKPNINHEKKSPELQRPDEREKYCNNTSQTCPRCDKEFFLFSALQSHIRRHGRQENRCDECGKIFSRSWLLKGHLRTHTGERPFNCPDEECDKAFADKSNLRSHMLIHSTKNKTHVCARCGRGFAQKRYLHKHMLEVCRLVIA